MAAGRSATEHDMSFKKSSQPQPFQPTARKTRLSRPDRVQEHVQSNDFCSQLLTCRRQQLPKLNRNNTACSGREIQKRAVPRVRRVGFSKGNEQRYHQKREP